LKNEIIFVHPLKTGGTTVNSAMNNSFWQTKPDFNYRHILGESGMSNAGDIFDPECFDKYKEYQIITMLRNPVDRVISEYYFMKDKPVFMNLILNKPKDFKTFIRSTQTANGVLNFLKGKRLYSTSQVRESDLDDVLDAIDEIPIHVGIFEQFEKSLQYFSNETGLTWKKEIEVKRITFRRPDLSDVTEEIKELIIEKNALDIALYDYCLDKFNEKNKNTLPAKIKFNKDKYNHVIPYSVKWNLFEFCMDNKKFLKSHFEFFKAMNFHLLENKRIRDGREFTQVWNKSFLNAMDHAFPGSELCQCVDQAYRGEMEDPLEETYQIAKALDLFFIQEKNKANKYYTRFSFQETLVHELPKKKGFFGRILRL